MKNPWILAFVVIVLTCCKNKRTTLTDETEGVTSSEFIEFFPDLKLPYNVADTSFNKKMSDSSLIGNRIFAQFVGDSVLKKQFGSKSKPKIYAVGKVPVKNAETYLFVRAVSGDKKGLYVLSFDEDEKFRAAHPMLLVDNDPQTSQTAGMDGRYTITTNRQRKQPDGSSIYRREAWVYTNAGAYTLILTESNEDVMTTGDLVNPIDTFSRKNKYSGDYVRDKRNMVAVRDGKNNSTMRFFVHFERDKGTCKGEVRGEATFVQPNVAVFRESGDPCVLQFTFTSGSVRIMEMEGCGNYRDIKCFFEGSFPKKREPKPKKK